MVRDRSAIYRPIRLNASRNCIFFLYPLPYRVFIKTRPINLRQFERCCFIIQIIAVLNLDYEKGPAACSFEVRVGNHDERKIVC